MALWNRKKKQDAAQDSAEPDKPGRLAQIKQTYDITKKADPKIPWILLACFLLPFLALLGIGFLIAYPILLGFLGFMTGLTLDRLGLRTPRRAGRLRRRSRDSPVRQRPPSTCCVAAGRSRRLSPSPSSRTSSTASSAAPVSCSSARATTPASEACSPRRSARLPRVAPDVSVHEIIAGSGEGEVPLRKLPRTVTKLPKSITAGQVNELNHRLKALGAQQGALPIPKGPMPRSAKQARSMRG